MTLKVLRNFLAYIEYSIGCTRYWLHKSPLKRALQSQGYPIQIKFKRKYSFSNISSVGATLRVARSAEKSQSLRGGSITPDAAIS